ncbi:MAG: DMT family transporter [Desulfobacterales bacterium]|nr:DMT family transporter [Desulfobacterales bacterium]
MPQRTTDRSVGNRGSPLWRLAAPALFILLWSGGFTALKVGLADAEPLTYLALRYGVVLALLGVLSAFMRPPLPRRAAEWGHQVVIGLLVQTLYFGLVYIAMTLGVSAGLQALILSLQPILVGVLAPRLVHERVGWLQWLGLLLGVLGAAIVITARAAIDAASAAGILCSVGALASMTAATLYEKRFGIAQHPVTSNLLQYAVGFAAVLPLAWALEEMRLAWTAPMIGALLYLAVGNSLIAVTLLLAMIRRGEAARVSALFFLVPPAAAAIAWLLIDEVMPAAAWLGMALATAGVALSTRASAPSR